MEIGIDTMDNLKVYEKFVSVSGEIGGLWQGCVSSFIRLSGCNLRCPYCDTQVTQMGEAGSMESLTSIMTWIREQGLSHIVITGGEPLKQRRVYDLISMLLHARDRQYTVSIETNGSIFPIRLFSKFSNIAWVFDYKLPSSGHMNDMMPLYQWMELTGTCFVKFACLDAIDFKYAVHVLEEMELMGCPISAFAFSPVNPLGDFRFELAELIAQLRTKTPVVYNLQIHKFIQAR